MFTPHRPARRFRTNQYPSHFGHIGVSRDSVERRGLRDRLAMLDAEVDVCL